MSADNACICAFTRERQLYRQVHGIFHFPLPPSSVDKIPALYPQSGTIFYALTAHKDCRKLSIPSLLADISSVGRKRKNQWAIASRDLRERDQNRRRDSLRRTLPFRNLAKYEDTANFRRQM